MVADADSHVFLVSSVPPPTGGISIWTRRFLDAAPRHGLAVLFRDVGLRNENELFDRSLRTHLRRAYRDFLQPLAAVVSRRPGIVHVCVSSGPSFLVGLAYAIVGAGLRIPTVVHVHGSLAYCSRRAVALARRLSSSSSVVFVTPSAADAEAFGFPVQIDNFVPRLSVLRDRPTGVHGLRLVHVGWMTRSKGIFELAEAVAELEGVSLDLYGPVVRRTELAAWQALVERLNAGSSIRYRGVLDQDEMLHRLTEYDALVVASHSESFGLAAAEAMMNQVAVLSTRTGFVQSLPDDCFTALPTRSASGIRRVITELAARPGALSEKTAAAFRFASSRLTEDVMFARWIALYERIVRQARVERRPNAAGAISGR